MLKLALFFGQWPLTRGQKVAFGGFNFLQRSLMVAHEAWCISSDPLEVTASVSRIPSDPLEVTVSRCGTATASQKVTFGHASIAA